MDVMDIYLLVGMNKRDPLALYQGEYKKADQKAMQEGSWDYDDPNFLCNRIRVAIENFGYRSLTPKEHMWFRRLRWSWYHHAISCAIKKADKRKAQEYAQKAMELQKGDYQTHITCILFYLVHDQLKKAKAHLRFIPQDELHKDEREDTGPWLIQQYESASWPWLKPSNP